MSFSTHGSAGDFKQGKSQKLLVHEEINFLASSDPANGATQISADGSQFSVLLESGIKVPKNAHNVQVSLQESTIWWTIPNVLTGVNDKMYITAPRASDSALTAYTVTIPQGLYDLTTLEKAVQRDLSNQGATISPSAVISFAADISTSKVDLIFNYDSMECDFTQADTPRLILGFDSQVLGPVASSPVIHLAENQAAFNTINSFLIHSDLVARGIRVNNAYNQTLGQVLIDVKPGSQITSAPRNPPKVSANELAGQHKSSIRFWVTDQANNTINMNNEFWTARLTISYSHPVWI